jgi:hypothetical protein
MCLIKPVFFASLGRRIFWSISMATPENLLEPPYVFENSNQQLAVSTNLWFCGVYIPA